MNLEDLANAGRKTILGTCKAIDWSRKNLINLKMAVYLGIPLGAINRYAIPGGTETSAGIQVAHNMIFPAINLKVCEHISQWTNSYLASTLIPTAAAFLEVYTAHKLLGTEEAFYSSIHPQAINLPWFAIHSWRYIKRFEQKERSISDSSTSDEQ